VAEECVPTNGENSNYKLKRVTAVWETMYSVDYNVACDDDNDCNNDNDK